VDQRRKRGGRENIVHLLEMAIRDGPAEVAIQIEVSEQSRIDRLGRADCLTSFRVRRHEGLKWTARRRGCIVPGMVREGIGIPDIVSEIIRGDDDFGPQRCGLVKEQEVLLPGTISPHGHLVHGVMKEPAEPLGPSGLGRHPVSILDAVAEHNNVGGIERRSISPAARIDAAIRSTRTDPESRIRHAVDRQCAGRFNECGVRLCRDLSEEETEEDAKQDEGVRDARRCLPRRMLEAEPLGVWHAGRTSFFPILTSSFLNAQGRPRAFEQEIDGDGCEP
jgi:hypothetical protein